MSAPRKKTWLEGMDRPAFVIAPLCQARVVDRAKLASGRERLPAKIALIQKGVADFYAVALHDLLGRPRGSQPISWARQVAMTMIHELTGATTTECAGAFSGRDHAAALYSRHAVKDAADTYPEIAAELRSLRERLKRQIAEDK